MAAPIGVRGSNPIWVLVNLAGKLFDDSYWMWVLENDIPYIPAAVYTDPGLSIPWTDPIQFLGNGTLPDNVYFTPGVVYRLEFRQHIGLGPPTQDDPLIYLVENYVAAAGGSTPVDTVAFSSTNQITNPQFALIDFISPYTFSGTNPAPINVAPGWFLELAGTGSVTITQLPLTSTTPTPSNAPYALELNLSGWTADSVFLRQRFYQSGVLWANQYVSTAITARVQGLNVTITASLVDSMGSTIAQLLSTPIDSSYNEYTGNALLPASTDTDTPPAAYIDYKIAIPSNVDISLTSIQVVVEDMPIEPSFEQDSINRQIDHTYNTAYPIVPIGTVIDFGGFGTPAHYLLCNGQAVSRTTYNQLFNVITNLETVTLTTSSATFTVVSGAKYRVGMGLEGVGIPAFTTIISISTNTITMSSPATATGAKSIRFFAAAPIYRETVTLTSTSFTFTVASAANYGIGMAITGSGIPSATIISNIVGTTVTMNKAATISGPSLLTFYAVGNGDASTTFNTYSLNDNVIAGAGGVIFGATSSGLGGQGGFATHTLLAAELPPHTHNANVFDAGSSSNFAKGNGSSGANTATTLNGPGSSTPFGIVQQTTLLYKYIRFE